MIRKEDNKAQTTTLISRIRILSKEDQKEVIKSSINYELINEYTNSLKEHKGEKNIEKYVEKANKTVDSLFDILYGEDVELRFRILNLFVDNFEYDISMIKGEICNHNHDFSEWKNVEESRPIYDKNGDVEHYKHNKYFERKCKYCGLVQKAYSDCHKERLEEEQKNWVKKHPKKLLYTPKNENTKN